MMDEASWRSDWNTSRTSVGMSDSDTASAVPRQPRALTEKKLWHLFRNWLFWGCALCRYLYNRKQSRGQQHGAETMTDSDLAILTWNPQERASAPEVATVHTTETGCRIVTIEPAEKKQKTFSWG